MLLEYYYNNIIEHKKFLMPHMPLHDDIQDRHLKHGLETTELNAVPPFTLLTSIWLCITGVNAMFDAKRSFWNRLEKLDQCTNVF